MRFAILAGLGFAAAATALLAQSPALAQAQKGVLEPAGEWKQRTMSDRCRISRKFGSDEESTTLWIEQSGPEPSYNISLIGNRVNKPFGPLLKLKFGDQAENLRTHSKTQMPDGRTKLSVFGVSIAPPSDSYDSETAPELVKFEEIPKVETLTIFRATPQPLNLAVGPLGEPLAILQICARDLAVRLESAGKASVGGAVPPKPINPERWIHPLDYPRDLLFSNQEGALVFRLTVNREGKATSCQALAADKEQLYRSRLCHKLMQYASFEPARNSEGEPVASYYFNTIRFKTRD